VTIRGAASYARQMARSLIVVLALATVFAVASAASGSGTAWPQPSARDKALLVSVLHGMKTDLRTVRLTQLTSLWREEKRRGTVELVTTTSVKRTAHARAIRADWDTLLIAHAYNERCVHGADHCLAVYRGPSGGGGAGRSGALRPLWSAHDLAQAIRQQFAAAKLHVTSIAFEHPHAFAPIVTVRSAHPVRALAAERKAWVALLPALRHSEGDFVQMLDRHGHVFYVGAGSGNTGEGWCAPFLHCPHL